MNIKIRQMREEDYDPVISNLNAWWGGRNMADMLPRLFVKYFSDTCLVAEDNGEIIGFVIGFFAQNDPEIAYIHFAGVHPEHRKKHIAENLYERFYQIAAKAGRSEICAVTSIVNKVSLEFHTKIGFSVIENGTKLAGVSYFKDYDGPGEDRFVFRRKNPHI